MSKKKIILVAGARPNFMKIAPLMREFRKFPKEFAPVLVHTGQHYDTAMSDVFFKDLNIPEPDINLNVGSASHTVQTARIMTKFERVLKEERPQLVIVVGDVNSTLACSLVASKMGVRVAHVEAGLRSFDRDMPEETNRGLTDRLSDYIFVTEPSGLVNLKKEGVSDDKVFYVGNVMIDTLLAHLPQIQKGPVPKRGQPPKRYAVLTLHRPGNVDSTFTLTGIYEILEFVTREIPVIYPIHPRARKMIRRHNFLKAFNKLDNLEMVEPLGYVDFIRLVSKARFVLTDSGGIQEEATVLEIPCLTMRENTERPVTVDQGTNILVGRNIAKIIRSVGAILNGRAGKPARPKFWDGKAAGRIVKVLSGQ